MGGQYVTRVTGEKQDVNFAPFASVEWNSGDRLSGFYTKGATRLGEGFDLSDRVPVPVGDYDLENLGFLRSQQPEPPGLRLRRGKLAAHL